MTRRKAINISIDWSNCQTNPSDTIIMPVCSGSPGVTGRRFTKSLEALSEYAQNVYIVMCDTLYRHNDRDEERCHKESNIWLETYLPDIRNNFEKVGIIRWNFLRESEGFSERLERMTNLYQTSARIQGIVHEAANFYLDAQEQRSKESNKPFDRTKSLKKSVQYLLEQYAGNATYIDQLGQHIPKAYYGVYLKDSDSFRDPFLQQPKTLPIVINGVHPQGH